MYASTIKSKFFRLMPSHKMRHIYCGGAFGGFQGQGIHWLSFRSVPMHVVPHNANFSVIFRYLHYFTYFIPSPGPPYLTRGFDFMLFMVYAYTSTIP